MNKKVPVVLVKTWINLARGNDTEAKLRALSMLREKVGTPEQISAFMKYHNIK